MAEAQMTLAGFYYSGIQGLPKDLPLSFYWLNEAATKRGHGPACMLLGDYYLQGYGVKRDPSQAFTCFLK